MDHLQRDLMRCHLDFREKRDHERQRGERSNFEQELQGSGHTNAHQLHQVSSAKTRESPPARALRKNHDARLHAVRDEGRARCGRHAHLQNEDEEHRERRVDDVRRHGGQHRRA